MRVGVVGGGFSGLLTAAKLARYVDVEVYEEHSTVGYPRHCTGLVSEYVVNYLKDVADGFVLNSFRRYLIVHTLRPRNPLELRFRRRVYLTDRPRLERELATTLQARGGVLKLGTNVSSVFVSRDAAILACSGRWSYDLVVVAEGARNVISRRLGLCKHVDYLVGIQSLIRYPNSLDTPYVLIGSDVSRDLFGWIVPVDEKYVIVGLADTSDVSVRLRYVLAKYLTLIVGNTSGSTYVTELFGGLIPISKPCRTVSDRVIGLGDAISSTKPLSGGGIYSICRQVSVLEDSIRLSDVSRVVKTYSLRVKGLVYELLTQHVVKLLITRVFGGLHNLILASVDRGISVVELLDYDRYIPGWRYVPEFIKLLILTR